MIERLLKKHLGNKNQKREALEDEIFENQNYIKLYKNKVAFYENEIAKLESELRQL